MKKAIYLFSVLALAGCNEDDVKDLVEGNTKVFTVTGANVQSKLGAIEPGYYSIGDLTNFMGSSPEELPVVENPIETLQNLGIDVKGDSTCGKIETNSQFCFEQDNDNSCLPPEINMLGLAVYTIDLDKVKTAADHGFYPTLATDIGGLYVDMDYQEVSCPVAGSS